MFLLCMHVPEAGGIFMAFPKYRPIRETRRGSDLIITRHGRPLLYFGNDGVSYIHSPVIIGCTN